jgi:hypothetical protein
MPTNTSPSSPASITSFVDADLYEQLYLDRMSEDDRMQFLENFFFVIYMRVVQRVLDSLGDEEQTMLQGLMKSRSRDVAAVRDFFQKHIPQFEQMEREEVGKYKKELIEDMGAMMQAQAA